MWLGWHTPRVDSLTLAKLYTRIENVHEVCKNIFVFYYVAAICTITNGKEKMRACVSRYDQSA